jgi:urease accessory protein
VVGVRLILAHLVTTGLGPVYDGMAHFALSAADVALIVALAAFGAMRGPRAARGVLAVLPAAWIAAGLLGLAVPGAAEAEWAGGAALLVSGLLLAADRELGPAFVCVVAALAAGIAGFLTGAALAHTTGNLLSLLGSTVALFLVAALVSGLVVSLRVFWARIAVRVVGSWIAAIGLLVLGWSLR